MSIAESKDSLKVVWHGGGIEGFSTMITRLIDDKHLIVLLNNTGKRNCRGINVGIVNILYGKSYDMPKKSITEILYENISKKDVASAIKHYHELKDMYPDDYDFSKYELNWLGLRLRDSGMLDEAIEIYKWIIEMYPDWWEAYNGFADVYRMKGDKVLAIKYYAKSLEMNPEMWYAKYMSEVMKELTEQDD
jgi:tetratricopeptide (TPR) repeat protein